MKLFTLVPSLVLLAAILLAVPAVSVFAGPVGLDSVITVNTAVDEDADNGTCSLREAIIAANTNTEYRGCPAGSSVGTDTITFAANYTITLGSQLPDVTTAISINGNGAANTIIQASTCNPITLPGGCAPASYRVFLVDSAGNLTLNNLTVRHGNSDYGGGIRNNGSLTLSSSAITSNQSSSSGGGIFSLQNSTLTIGDSTISDNRGSLGGGFYLGANSVGSVAGSAISSNGAANYGGGINNVGTLTVTNSTITGNTADRVGGGIRNDSVLTVSNSVISDNDATEDGGGIFNFGLGMQVTINNSILSGNQAGEDGGGLYNFSGTVTINNSTFSGNTAANFGGGLYNETTTNSLTATASTISGNTGGIGGGMYNQSGALLATNVTLSGNNALSAGGIRNESGTLTLTNVTLSNNDGFISGGGLTNGSGATLHFRNTLIANSTNGDCINQGAITTNLNNLAEDGSCSSSYSGDPSLGALASNGGTTQTHALLSNSKAINKGTNSGCPAADQRGKNRPQGAKCDIGAYEFVFPIYKSQGSNDGWVLESGENSSKGGTLNKTAATFRLGDDAADKQYRSILSFNTAPLPDTAVITKVTLKIKKQGQVGTNPFATHGRLDVDIRTGVFGGNSALQVGDFQAAASKNAVGSIPNTPASGWYKKVWNGTIFAYINKIGLTQFRLRFATGDNDDLGADYISFFSGNYGTAAARPTLIIEYYVP